MSAVIGCTLVDTCCPGLIAVGGELGGTDTSCCGDRKWISLVCRLRWDIVCKEKTCPGSPLCPGTLTLSSCSESQTLFFQVIVQRDIIYKMRHGVNGKAGCVCRKLQN